jgi:hypothetical protein
MKDRIGLHKDAQALESRRQQCLTKVLAMLKLSMNAGQGAKPLNFSADNNKNDF